METRREFLSAEWRNLVILNYEVDPAILLPRLPRGTELDLWRGKALVSIVGFQFLKTKIFGVPVPLYQNFEEVNLRFYVRRHTVEGVRRGVVFIKEIVPRWAVAQIARTFYKENYIALPMDNRIDHDCGNLNDKGIVEYSWRVGPRWHHLRAKVDGPATPLAAGSEEEFITEHYWGYAAQTDGGCIEYPVDHPRWQIRPVREPLLETDVAMLYGPEFVEALDAPPMSAFLAEGSPVTLYCGKKLCDAPVERTLARALP